MHFHGVSILVALALALGCCGCASRRVAEAPAVAAPADGWARCTASTRDERLLYALLDLVPPRRPAATPAAVVTLVRDGGDWIRWRLSPKSRVRRPQPLSHRRTTTDL